MGASVTSLGRKKNLSSLLQYAANPSKKEKCVAVTGINCNDELEKAYLMMNRTRTKMNRSKDVTQAYHVIHSFDKEISKELSEEQMHKIAVEFAEKAFPHCQIIVASHNDKEHFHSHLVINNIDTETGKRIRIDPKDLENMREINDTILKNHELEPIDNEYYDSLFRRNNIYVNDPSKLKKGQVNYQQVIQNAIDEVLRDKTVTSFEKFSDTLAKNHDIEVYKFSKNSNKLGYVLYKKEANFYENREKFIALGKDKVSRKIREPYVEKTFSAKKI
ncbi:TPA: relaxase/mobilization nuclease domain-containing protein, partial [Enterococcus faecium]